MFRTWKTAVFAALLVAMPLWAENGHEKDAANETTSAAAKKNVPAGEKAAEKPAAAGYGAEIEQLREMIIEQARALEVQQKLMREQQGKLAVLTEELRAAHTGGGEPASAAVAAQPGTPAAPQGAELEARLAKVEKDAAANKKSAEDGIKRLGPLSFSGDFRLRDEPFFGGPTNQSKVRNRERFRARLNINAKLNDEISGGLSLGSGDINDPISTNQTTNQFYTRKPFILDRAFINYTPHDFKPLTLTGGKFAYPFYRTELTWDNDLNPEGLAQTLQWNFEKTPVLKRIALVGFELPFSEVAGVPVANKSIVQSAVYGGQLQTVWQLAGWLKLSAYAAFYNYHNADPIALALRQANAANPQSPLNGLLPLGGSSVQDSITTITRNTIVTANTGAGNTPTALPTGVTTITSAQFASKFGLFDTIARFDIKTSVPRLPIVVLGDYVQNTRACANIGNLPALGTTTTATAITTVAQNAACVSRERRGYWLEGRFGRLSEVKDLQFSYTRMFIEREAVMGAFNFSDLRQASNVSQHRVEVIYQAHKNVQLEFTGLFGRPLNWNVAAGVAPEPILKRLQFDVIYKF